MFTTVILLALGVFTVINLVKALLPFRALAPAKLILAFLLSQASWAYASGWREGILLVCGVFGLSTLFHGLHKLLEGAGDERRVATIQRGRRR